MKWPLYPLEFCYFFLNHRNSSSVYYFKPKRLSLFILLLYYYQCVAFFPHALSRQTTKIVGHDWLWRNGFITTTHYTYIILYQVYIGPKRNWIPFSEAIISCLLFYGIKYHRTTFTTFIKNQWKMFFKKRISSKR